MKKGVVVFCFLLMLSFVSAVAVGDNIPIQIQTLDSSGSVITGTFEFKIDISNSASCTPVLYSNTSTRTTDSRGIVSYNLENVNLSFDEQYWFCYYRNGVLKDTVKAARVPYTFRAKNVTLSGVDIDTNLMLGIYNITAGIGNFGAGLSLSGYRLNVIGNVNISGNLTLGVGRIMYNSSGGNYIYYNGTAWYAFGTGTGGSTTVTQVPAGSIMAFNLASCPTGWILADGTSGTPDLRGIFIRGSGTSGVLKYANDSLGYFTAGIGTYQNDSFQGHEHQYTRTVLGTTDWIDQESKESLINTQSTFNIVEKSGYGTPRYGAETSPAYYATIYCVKTSEDTPVSNTIWGSSGDNIFVQNMSLNVGIGTSSPTAKLEVNGSLNVTGNITSSNGRVFDKTGYAGIPGEIKMYGGSTAPTGWLLCDGAAVSRTTYSDLFAIIGMTYGSGDGSTTFNVPNFASKFPRGNTAGATGGSDDAVVVSHNHTFTGTAMAAHSHGLQIWASGANSAPVRGASGSSVIYNTEGASAGTPAGTISTTGSSGTGANVPAYVGVNFIIKY